MKKFVRGDTAYYNLESILRAFKRKEMKASRRLAENDIITRGVTVKIQQVAVRGNYEIRLTMPRVKMSRADHNPWLAKMLSEQLLNKTAKS